MAGSIHPTAVVSPEATIRDNVRIGPHCVVEGNVTIGEDSILGPLTVIQGPTIIGRGNRFYGQSSIGTDPQDLKYAGEHSELHIGSNNRIREFVTINRGTGAGRGRTDVGSHNLLMTAVHIAHDCQVGDSNIFGNAATLAGHVDVPDHCNIGAFSAVHQFCRLGPHAWVGGFSVITKDALPFIKTVGSRGAVSIFGINSIGLQRKGFSEERIDTLRQAYRWLFRKGLRTDEAIEEIHRHRLHSHDVKLLIEFIENSERGVIRSLPARNPAS